MVKDKGAKNEGGKVSAQPEISNEGRAPQMATRRPEMGQRSVKLQ